MESEKGGLENAAWLVELSCNLWIGLSAPGASLVQYDQQFLSYFFNHAKS